METHIHSCDCETCDKTTTKTVKTNPNSKYTYEDIVKFAEENNCKINTKKEEYDGRQTFLINFDCSCEKCNQIKNLRAFMSDPICSQCARTKGRTGKTKLENFKDLCKLFEKEGYKILTSLGEYGSLSTYIIYKCNKGHEHKTTGNRFKSGHRCPTCARIEKTDFDWMKEKFKKLGFEIKTTEEEFLENGFIIVYICKCNEEKEVSWRVAKLDTWKCCVECMRDGFRHSYEFIKNTIEENGGILLSETYTNVNEKLFCICPCGEYVEISFKDFQNGRRCIACAPSRRAQTNLEIYGCENVFQNKEIKEKCRETCIKKYGVPHVMMLKEMVEKVKNTNLAKYGKMYKFITEEILEKIKQTNIEKYGVEYPMQNEEIREKSKKTCAENYGVLYPLQDGEILDKALRASVVAMVKKYDIYDPNGELEGIKDVYKVLKKVCLKKYGVECVLSLEEFRKKSRATCLEKYGVDYPMQNPEIFAKAQANSYKTKPYTMPSGKIVYYQGYENFKLDALLANGYKEEDIFIGTENVPPVWYISPIDFNLHLYYPDIWLPKENKYIEVKSTFTYEQNRAVNWAKWDQVSAMGFNMEIEIYLNKKGDLDQWIRYPTCK